MANNLLNYYHSVLHQLFYLSLVQLRECSCGKRKCSLLFVSKTQTLDNFICSRYRPLKLGRVKSQMLTQKPGPRVQDPGSRSYLRFLFEVSVCTTQFVYNQGVARDFPWKSPVHSICPESNLFNLDCPNSTKQINFIRFRRWLSGNLLWSNITAVLNLKMVNQRWRSATLGKFQERVLYIIGLR